MLRLKVTPVVGLPQFTGWSQVAESTASISARLIVVYAISGKHAGNVGRDIGEKVSDFYFYDVEQLHDFLQQLVAYAHSNECKIYFSSALLGRNKSVFATYGGSVFLRRGEKSGKILMSDFEVKVVEGSYVDDDIFVLTTLQADQFLSEIQLKFNQGYDTDVIITSVVPGLHAQDDSSLSALVFISKDETASEDIEKLREEAAPFFEVEDNLENPESLNDETNEECLAQVKFEVEDVKVPGFLDEKVAKFKPIVISFFRKVFGFWIWLLRILKRISLRLWIIFRRINFSKVKDTVGTIRQSGLRSVFDKPSTYFVNTKQKKGLWKYILVVVVIIAILIAFAFFSYQRRNENQRITQLILPLETQVAQAKEIAVTDPITAREMVTNAIDQIKLLEQENSKSSAVELFAQSMQSWNEYLESISGREELRDLDIFYDLRLAKSDFISSGIDISGKNLVIFDSEMKQVLLLEHDSKRVLAVDLSNREILRHAVINNSEVFTLVDGVYKFEVDFDSEPELEEVKVLGDSNRNATLLDAYDRYVYVVNPEKRNIYRYAESEDGYSDPVGWMRSATGIQYEQLRSISVDGNVWLTTSDGQIKKFANGAEESFALRGLELAFEQDLYVYTNENLENLYVLDPANNRVVLLSKTGDFIREYKSVSLGAASNLAVSEELGKIFVTSGSIIYQINL